QEICTTEGQLAPFIDSFDNAIMVSAEHCAVLLLEAPHCPDAVASALLALADVMRTTAWQQSNRYYQFTSEMPRSQPPERDAERLLQRAEATVRSQSARWPWLTTRWPVWRLLDRLGAAEAVNVSSGSSWFWMYVFPHRVRSDGIISNRIRATSKAYCLQLFQDEVRRLLEQPRHRPRKLRLVEVGPHIGDCMLWAAAEFREQTRATAVEPVAQVVSLFRRSIAANGFEPIIDLHHAFCGSENSGGTEAPATMLQPSIPWIRLDSVVDEDVDVLKIHTNGGERQILDGAEKLFVRHEVRVVILHSAEAHQLWPSTTFLLHRNYDVTVDGRRMSQSGEDEAWLRTRVAEVGGLQLHASKEVISLQLVRTQIHAGRMRRGRRFHWFYVVHEHQHIVFHNEHKLNVRRTITDGGDCLADAAKVGVDPALEKLGDCLAHACEAGTTSSSSASTTTTTTKDSSRPMTEQEMERSCPGFVDNTCKEDKVCKDIWLCMSTSMKTCSDGSECIQRTVSIMPPTPAAEEIGACLEKACTAGSSTSSTSTPALTTTKDSRPIHSEDVSAACPGFIDQTCSPDSTCADAWKCMGSMKTCQQGSQCIEQVAKIGTTSALEELATCLEKACTPTESGRIKVVI
ncbi:unnamed protein product, partial [Symbiodinium necroappetens]